MHKSLEPSKQLETSDYQLFFFFFGFPYGKKRQIFVLGIIKRKWSEPQGETFLRKTYLSASHPCPRANVALLRGPCKNCSW